MAPSGSSSYHAAVVAVREAANLRTPSSRLAELCEHENTSVRCEALKNPCTPLEALEKWIHCDAPAWWEQAAILESKAAPTDYLKRVLDAAIQHNGEGEDVSRTLEKIAKNPSSTNDMLTELLQAAGWEYARAVASNASASAAVLADAATCLSDASRSGDRKTRGFTDIRHFLMHQNIDDKTLSLLVPTVDGRGRRELARHHKAGPQTARVILDTRSTNAHRTILMNCHDIPEDCIAPIDPYAQDGFAYAIAGNRSATADHLSRLSQDPDSDTRTRVASNPNTPADILVMLAVDESADVAAAAAEELRRRNTP